MNDWYTAKIVPGRKKGREIGFPTINLDDPSLMKGQKEGVYVAQVRIQEKNHWGMLYYGPRLINGETHNSIEIHLFGFDEEIYGVQIQFRVYEYVRGIIAFTSFEELRDQLQKDERDSKEFIKMVTNT